MVKKKKLKRNKKYKKRKLRVVNENFIQQQIKGMDKIATERHEVHDVFLARMVFWSSIAVVVIANILTSIVLIPFLSVLSSWFRNFVVVVIALIMGFLYNYLLIDIGHMDRRHHLLAGVVVPLIAVVNVVVMVGISNQIIDSFAIQTMKQSQLAVGLMYGIAFIIPYVIDRMRLEKKMKPIMKSL